MDANILGTDARTQVEACMQNRRAYSSTELLHFSAIWPISPAERFTSANNPHSQLRIAYFSTGIQLAPMEVGFISVLVCTLFSVCNSLQLHASCFFVGTYRVGICIDGIACVCVRILPGL
jgi:hypothetical protein